MHNRGSNEGYVYFFQNEDFPNLYLIMEHGKDCNWYDRFKRLGRYSYENLPEDAKANGLDFGYPKLNVKPPVRIEVEKYHLTWQFVTYLKENYFKEYVADKETDLLTWGWYKYDGTIESEKWLKDFTAYENRRREELLKANNIVVQTSLF